MIKALVCCFVAVGILLVALAIETLWSKPKGAAGAEDEFHAFLIAVAALMAFAVAALVPISDHARALEGVSCLHFPTHCTRRYQQ